MRRVQVLVIASTGLLAVGGIRPATAGPEAYIEGLDALARGDFDGARRRFEAEVEANDDDPAAHLALGVALTFLERLQPALQHVDRAGSLERGQKAPRLWKATILAMEGHFPEDSNF